MELRQLRYFVAVAETRHFGQAARALHIATPSLSQQIRTLERDLHVVLLERSPRRVELTPAGERLLEHARTLLAQAELARLAVRSAGERRERLAMRVAPGAAAALSRLLGDLPALAPAGVEVGAALCPDSDATQAVRQQRADAAIVWIRCAADQDLAAVTLRDVPVRIAVPAGHRLAAQEQVRVGDLAGEIIVLFPRDLAPGLWDRLADHLVPAAARPATTPGAERIRIESGVVTGDETLLRAVAAGAGAAPTVPGPVDHATVEGIAVRPLLPPLTVPLELVWREPARPALRRFLARLEAGGE